MEKSKPAMFATGKQPAHSLCFRIRLEDESVLRCLRPKGHDGKHRDPELCAEWEDLQEEPAAHAHDWTPDGAALASLLLAPVRAPGAAN